MRDNLFLSLSRNLKAVLLKSKPNTVIQVYSEHVYNEYPHIVNDLLCSGHSIIESNGKKYGFSETAYCEHFSQHG